MIELPEPSSCLSFEGERVSTGERDLEGRKGVSPSRRDKVASTAYVEPCLSPEQAFESVVNGKAREAGSQEFPSRVFRIRLRTRYSTDSFEWSCTVQISINEKQVN